LFFRGKALSLSSLFAQSGGVGLHGIKVRLIIFAMVVIIFFVALTVAIRPVPARVQITFLGFTNVSYAPQVTRATFGVSNAGRCSLQGWDVYNFDRKSEPHDPSVFHIVYPPSISELKPGEFKIISYNDTPQDEPWRLALLLDNVDWRFRLNEKWPYFFRRLPGPIRRRLTPQFQEFCSGWISPVSESNATNTAKSSAQ
jgi:hypothetical protein